MVGDFIKFEVKLKLKKDGGTSLTALSVWTSALCTQIQALVRTLAHYTKCNMTTRGKRKSTPKIAEQSQSASKRDLWW